MNKKPGSVFIVILFCIVLAAAFIIPQHSWGQKPAGTKWLTIKQWRGKFTVLRQVSKMAQMQGMTETIKLQETTSGSVILSDKYTEEGFATWTGPTSATTTITATRVLSIGQVSITETVSGNGRSRDSNEYGEGSGLSIDITTGTYDVGFSGGEPEIKWTRSVDGATKNAISQIEATPVRNYFLAVLEGLEKGQFSIGLTSGIGFLPGNQQEFTNISSWFEKPEDQGQKLPDKLGALTGRHNYTTENTSIETTWSLSPSDGQMPEYFLTFEDLEEFKTKLPEPGTKVRLKVYTKDENPIAVPVRFTIEECSQEPGTCLNSREADNDYDLEFDLESGGTEVYRDGKLSVRTKEAVTLAFVDIKIKDYAAFASIYAEIEIDDIRQKIQVDFSGDNQLLFPWDENANYIADQWEKDHKIFKKNNGLQPFWDEEKKPSLDKEPGDGLSIYEEYRGLEIKGQHTRLNPNFKELVIENRTGQQKISQGISLFSRASGVKVIELKQGELPNGRVVNFNSRAHRNMEQHGIIIITASLPDADLGQTIPLKIKERTPKDVERIEIEVAAFKAW